MQEICISWKTFNWHQLHICFFIHPLIHLSWFDHLIYWLIFTWKKLTLFLSTLIQTILLTLTWLSWFIICCLKIFLNAVKRWSYIPDLYLCLYLCIVFFNIRSFLTSAQNKTLRCLLSFDKTNNPSWVRKSVDASTYLFIYLFTYLFIYL